MWVSMQDLLWLFLITTYLKVNKSFTIELTLVYPTNVGSPT